MAACLLAPGGGPLALAAAKSATGHTEPAAGALGLVQLALELGQVARAPLHHLALPSAHVVGTLPGSGGRSVFLPRQCASAGAGSADAAHAGGVSR